MTANPTQRDREAAARHLGYQHWADMVAWGVDGTALAEAFARHAAEVREECAKIAEAEAEFGKWTPPETVRRNIAAAIRAGGRK